MLSIHAYADPYANASKVLDCLREAADRGATAAEPAGYLASAGMVTGAFYDSLSSVPSAIDSARAEGRLGILPRLLATQAILAVRLPNWDIAIPAAEEASRLAIELDQPIWLATAQTAVAMIGALRGDPTATEQATARAEQIALPLGASHIVALAQSGPTLSALAQGRHDEALQSAERLFDPSDPAYHLHFACMAIGDLAEAAAHAGRSQAARERVAEVEALVGDDPAEWVAINLRHARALLAEDDHEAASRFEEALSADLDRWPFWRGRLLLAHGRGSADCADRRDRVRRTSRVARPPAALLVRRTAAALAHFGRLRTWVLGVRSAAHHTGLTDLATTRADACGRYPQARRVVYLTRLRARRHRRAELGARGDPELREHPVQVRADRAMGEVEPLPDLAIRKPVCSQLGDLQLLSGQLIARLRYPAPAALAGSAQLGSCLVSPVGRANDSMTRRCRRRSKTGNLSGLPTRIRSHSRPTGTTTDPPERTLVQGAAASSSLRISGMSAGEDVATGSPPVSSSSRGAASLPYPNLAVGTVNEEMPFDHIVVVMMENHSFDNLLGALPRTRADVDGLTFDGRERDQLATQAPEPRRLR